MRQSWLRSVATALLAIRHGNTDACMGESSDTCIRGKALVHFLRHTFESVLSGITIYDDMAAMYQITNDVFITMK